MKLTGPKGASRQTVRAARVSPRITSYNVCYTKLLRELDPRLLPEAEVADVAVETFGTDGETDLDRADVRGQRQHVLEAQQAELVPAVLTSYNFV